MAQINGDSSWFSLAEHWANKIGVPPPWTMRDLELNLLPQGESVNILLNFTQFFETRIEYRFQIFTAHSCDFLLPSYARLA
ncbi:hypothetical protein, partial [Aeromonas salmonicida]|uniref:hypothetical protein n=1 Tax=Aeromonas salmonicida TaxID=645 RepID=UPI0035A5D672